MFGYFVLAYIILIFEPELVSFEYYFCLAYYFSTKYFFKSEPGCKPVHQGPINQLCQS